jgi:predicted ATPase
MRDGMAASEATGARATVPFFLALVTEVLALGGKIEEGLATLDDALAKAAASGERGWDTEIHRLRGEFAARSPHFGPAKAEDSFSTALAIGWKQTSCAPPRASPGCGTSRAGGERHASCSYPSTAGSPRA